MSNQHDEPQPRHERMLLIALAACCVGPMVAIIVLTSVIGIALGRAVAISLGLVAAAVCVGVMVQRHRGESHHGD